MKTDLLSWDVQADAGHFTAAKSLNKHPKQADLAELPLLFQPLQLNAAVKRGFGACDGGAGQGGGVGCLEKLPTPTAAKLKLLWALRAYQPSALASVQQNGPTRTLLVCFLSSYGKTRCAGGSASCKSEFSPPSHSFMSFKHVSGEKMWFLLHLG